LISATRQASEAVGGQFGDKSPISDLKTEQTGLSFVNGA
jgi:hypothetical protein